MPYDGRLAGDMVLRYSAQNHWHSQGNSRKDGADCVGGGTGSAGPVPTALMGHVGGCAGGGGIVRGDGGGAGGVELDYGDLIGSSLSPQESASGAEIERGLGDPVSDGGAAASDFEDDPIVREGASGWEEDDKRDGDQKHCDRTHGQSPGNTSTFPIHEALLACREAWREAHILPAFPK